MISATADRRHGLGFQFRRACCRTIVASRAGAPAVALTFDDGPDPETTPALLDALAARDARATFFVLGRQVAAHPRLARRIVDAGHAIGNHAYSHASLPTLPLAAVWRELRATARAIADATGSAPALLRPPFGDEHASTHLLARAMGYRVVHWSVSGEDWRGEPAAAVTRRVCDAVGPGAIVLLHDGQPPTVAALPAMLDALSARGLAPVTVPELLRRGPLQRRLWPAPEPRA